MQPWILFPAIFIAASSVGAVSLPDETDSSVWKIAFAKNPDPQPRDLVNNDYFVIEYDGDPGNAARRANWTIVEPMPIPNHWLASVPVGSKYMEHRLSKRDAPINIYHSGLRRLQKRIPVPISSSQHAGCMQKRAKGSSVDSKMIDSIRQEFNISDPLFHDQWHIVNTVEPGHDMNVVPVWRSNITGNGVTVAIVDDGIDYNHPDFETSFSLEGSWDYNFHTQWPTPELADDTHGTRCAGEIAAGMNDVCGVGLAPGAKVAGIRILSGRLTEADEARSLIHRLNVNDIFSCSWGPSDDGKTIEGPAPIVKRAELAGIEEGRNGKGAIYVVASGNGDFHGDNCNYDGYTNSIYSITISAVDRNNAHPFYAESCSANMAVTYSSNIQSQIVTSDRRNVNFTDNTLLDDHLCTNSHTGTSAAAPIAAAVFALVLEARPDLTWRDLQYLVRNSAQPFEIQPGGPSAGPNGTQWQTTKDGHYYHNSYGYGVIDSEKIVSMAKSWQLVGPQSWFISQVKQLDGPLKGKEPFSDEIEVTAQDLKESNLRAIEHVRIRVDYEYERRGALKFVLKSPDGIISELAAPRPNDEIGGRVIDWDFMSVVHWGESGIGKWTIEVTGEDPHVGFLHSWQLKLFGEALDGSKARRFSEVWDNYEIAAPRIHDAIDDATQTSVDPTLSSSTTIAFASSTHSAPLTTTLPSSPTQALPAPPDTPQPTLLEPPTNGDTINGTSGHHGLLYYAVVTTLGIGAIIVMMLPVAWCMNSRKRRGGVHLGDFSLASSDIELSDFAEDASDHVYIVSDDEPDNVPGSADSSSRNKGDQDHLLG